ncbi:MAG: glucokinase [Rhodocyclales bacterium]|nr:glucokinase [Rhodocyclales bacterium]
MSPRNAATFLAADVGGTRTRFLLARWRKSEAAPDAHEKPPDTPSQEGFSRQSPAWEPLCQRVLADDAFASFTAALDAFLADCPPEAKPELAVIALAGPVTGRRARLTNRPWTIDADALAARHGWLRVELMNDFAAQAHGIAAAARETLHVLQEGEIRPGLAAVLGPGTGLGMGFFLREGETVRVFPSEGGHADLGGFDPPFLTSWSAWLAREGRIASWESLLCGPGLVRLTAFLAAARGQSAPWTEAPQIVAAAQKGEALAHEAVVTFVRTLGACAGDLALIGWTLGGVYLVGALAAALRPWLEGPAFRAAFTAKERHGATLGTLPILLADDPLLGLKGAARFACRLLAATTP